MTCKGSAPRKCDIPAVLYEIPNLTGVMAKVVFGVPIARSQVTARSQAAPQTLLWSIAITGTVQLRTRRRTRSNPVVQVTASWPLDLLEQRPCLLRHLVREFLEE